MLDLPLILLAVVDMFTVHVTTSAFCQAHCRILERTVLEVGTESFCRRQSTGAGSCTTLLLQGTQKFTKRLCCLCVFLQRASYLAHTSDWQPCGHEGQIKSKMFAGHIVNATCVLHVFLINDGTLLSLVPILGL